MPEANEAPGAKIDIKKSPDVDGLLLIKQLDPEAISGQLGSIAEEFSKTFNSNIENVNKITLENMPKKDNWFSNERSNYIAKQNRVTEVAVQDLDVARIIMETKISEQRKEYVEKFKKRTPEIIWRTIKGKPGEKTLLNRIERDASELALNENRQQLIKEINTAIAIITGEQTQSQVLPNKKETKVTTKKKPKKPLNTREYRRKILGGETNPYEIN